MIFTRCHFGAFPTKNGKITTLPVQDFGCLLKIELKLKASFKRAFFQYYTQNGSV